MRRLELDIGGGERIFRVMKDVDERRSQDEGGI
jgi:hypothetical protein